MNGLLVYLRTGQTKVCVCVSVPESDVKSRLYLVQTASDLVCMIPNICRELLLLL